MGARLPRLSGALAGLVAALLAHGAAADPAAWRIEGERGGEITLLGSMHVLRASDYPLPPLVDELYARADVLVMELDLDDLDPAAEQAALRSAAMLPAGNTLPSVLDAGVYKSAQQHARALGIDLELLDHAEPWLVAVTLLDLGMHKMGFEAERGVEQYLVGKAAHDHKEIIGLETIEKQVGIFHALPAKDQRALLAQTLEELDSADTTMSELTTAWRDGHLETMTEKLLADFDDFPQLYPALVTERNAAWTDELERRLEDGQRYLVVVGALHLVGKDSVIERLGARGHRVLRVGAQH
ncbi:MAG TPA: TraB/GumN family protein [Gammaproteobacteria bacterium]|nr:TraB/GumN family protein [Gammaproteobacteria bacterium]